MRLTTVHRPDEACTLALNRALLSHHARAAVERARQNPDVLRIRDVSCTEDDARDLARFFATLADADAILGQPWVAVCAEAEDAARFPVS